MSKYVIAWPHRVGDLYFHGFKYSLIQGHKVDGTVEDIAKPKTARRTANLSEAMLFDSMKVAQDYFDVEIAPDTTAFIKEVTDKEIFHAKLADDPVASKKQNGISS